MQIIHKPIDAQGYGLSFNLWKNFPSWEILGLHDRNVGIGFFDDFTEFHASTLEGPYLLLETTGVTIEQINCTGNSATTALGLLKIAHDGSTAEDEGVIQWGRGLCAPFKLVDHDVCFEARIAVSANALVTALYSWGIGLGEVGMGATDCLFVDTTQALADKNFCGFVHLQAETTYLDGAFKADGGTYQDGATKTKLNALKTVTALTFFKVGFRYCAVPKSLKWFVDGVETSAAVLTATELDAATFPDDVFMAPIFGIKAHATTAADAYMDWWACAQTV